MIDQQTALKVMPALCLDLDGTVRRSKSGKEFIEGPDDVEVFPDVEERLLTFKREGFVIIGLTNQGGVAYGFKTTIDIGAEHQAMIAQFKENPFNLIYSSYSHPKGTVAPYNFRSLTRKPEIGMLALAEHQLWLNGIIVDWDNSLFVGDRDEDEECAARAGIVFIHANNFFHRQGEQAK